jgi:anthranilate synthase component 2
MPEKNQKHQKKTLVIDNYDSFVFNLVQYIGELGGNPIVYRNDKISLKEIKQINPTHILISPGPGHPADTEYFGICSEVIQEMGKTTPVLGVCLGHQGITTTFGGEVIKAPEIMHGKTSPIEHNEKGLFAGIENPLVGMRYHSLIANPKNFPEALEITAQTKKTPEHQELIMGLKHKKFPIYGVQFHPESIGSPDGKKMIANFLAME